MPTKSGLACAAGHCFDRAKQGYYNLLQPQDSRSKHPGDADSAVDARQRWLQRGHMAGLVSLLSKWCQALQIESAPTSIDLGCGEGTFGAALFGDEAQNFCGIDLSRRAILLARKKLPSATWVQANADRRLPVPDATCHRVLSLFGRRPAKEICRILAPGGICLIAVPGSNDLVELREHVQQAGHQRDRTALIVEQFSKEGLQLTDRAQWSHRVDLDREAISDALAMTYRGVRHSQQARLESLDSLHVTLEAELMKFEHAPETAPHFLALSGPPA